MSDIVLPSWRDRLEGLVGRRREVAVLVGVVGAAVMLALVAWSRGRPAIAPPATSVAGAPDTLTSSPTVGVVLVHVAGAVRAPGLYEFPAGARVADAIRAAGGPRPSADLGALNLAELLVDGGKLEVPRQGGASNATPLAAAPAAGPAAGLPAAVIPLNSADQVALEAVPGLGPVKAAAIVAYRSEIGSFSTIEQLLDVTGIGPATLEAIRPYLTL